MNSKHIQVIGLPHVQRLFRDLNITLTEKRLKKFFYAAGRVVVRKARPKIEFTGQIKKAAKKDLGVFSDGNSVKVGLLFLDHSINGKTQKVAPIVRHMTEDFKQTSRKGRGKVSNRGGDFVLEAFNENQTAVEAAMVKPIQSLIKRIAKRKGITVR